MSSEDDGPVIRLRSRREDDLETTLRAAQRLLVEFPIASQRLFSALVAEGRRYAETEEGAELKEQLSRSRLLKRSRVAWEVVTLNMLREQPTERVPSAILEAFVRLASEPRLERKLGSLFLGSRRRGAD